MAWCYRCQKDHHDYCQLKFDQPKPIYKPKPVTCWRCGGTRRVVEFGVCKVCNAGGGRGEFQF